MNADVPRREKFKALFGALALALVVTMLAPVASYAANVVTVKIKGKAKIADTTGSEIESNAIADLGLLGAPGSSGALAVRNFAGGGGLLGTGDCTEASGLPDDIRPNTSTIAASATTIITGILISGSDAKVSVSAPDLDNLIGPGPVIAFQTTAGDQNVFVGLGNGLTVFPSELVFTCTGADGGDGSGNYVLLGQ